MVNGMHSWSAFLTSGIHANIHTNGGVSHARGQPALHEQLGVRGLAQGHLDTPLGGARDRTSNLPVTMQPTPLYLLSHMLPPRLILK